VPRRQNTLVERAASIALCACAQAKVSIANIGFAVRLRTSTEFGRDRIDQHRIHSASRFTNAAEVVSESTDKPESMITFEPATAAVRTIATWVPASRQALDGVPALRSLIDSELTYGVRLAEEAEIFQATAQGNTLTASF